MPSKIKANAQKDIRQTAKMHTQCKAMHNLFYSQFYLSILLSMYYTFHTCIIYFMPCTLLPNDHLYLGRCVSTTFSMTFSTTFTTSFTTSYWVSFWVSLSLKYDFLIQNLECKNKFFFTKSALFLSLLIVNAVSSQLPYTTIKTKPCKKTRTNTYACPSFSFIEFYSVFNILVQRYHQGCVIFCYKFKKNNY